MANNFVQVGADGTGKKFQTYSGTVGSDEVHAEAVVLVDTSQNPITSLSVTGPLTNAQLRASAVPVDASSTVQFTEITDGANIADIIALGTATTAASVGMVVTGPLTDAQLRASNVNVAGIFWQTTQPISGTVNVGNFPATQPISGSVNIGNFPAVQPASQSGTWYVQAINSTSTVNSPNASNFLATVSGTVAATQSGDWTVKQSNASNFLATVAGTVTAVQSNASNFLTTVSGTVAATQSGANWTVDHQKILGTTIDVNSGTKSAGTQRVVLATDQPALTNKLLVTPDSNIAVDVARIQGQASVASVAGVQDVMPRKRTGATGLSPSYISGRISTSTTTTIVAATCYLSSLHMTCANNAGTTWALTVRNGEATFKVLVPNFVLNANFGGSGIFQNPISLAYAEPIVMTNGINVVTVGGTPGNVDYFATYWQ